MTAGQPGVRTWETSKEISPTTVPVLGSVSWHCWRPPLPTWHCTFRRQLISSMTAARCEVSSRYHHINQLCRTALQASAYDARLMNRHACQVSEAR
jgi:hypothetical protein